MSGMHPPFITNLSALKELCVHLRDIGRFGVDTEFVSEETFDPVLCLIQVATRSRLAVIDPLAIADLSPFWDVLLDPAIDVVMHGPSEDLRIIKLKTGRVPDKIFDIQTAAGLVGMSYPMSHTNLVNHFLGITLVAGESRTDWRKRPLTSAQIHYALEDVRHLLDLADLLKNRLESLGRRDWMDEQITQFLGEIASQVPEERWRKLPGLQNLNRRGLEIAKRLFEWRLDEARYTNKPARFVMRDDLLVAIAKRQPGTVRDLEALRDFNRPALIKRAREILDVVIDAKRIPEENLPEHQERHDDGPGVSMVVNLLQTVMSYCCTKKHVSASLTGTVSDLRELVRWHLKLRPEDECPSLIQGWRAEVCGRELLGVLDGRITLRVANPLSNIPIELADGLTESAVSFPNAPADPAFDLLPTLQVLTESNGDLDLETNGATESPADDADKA